MIVLRELSTTLTPPGPARTARDWRPACRHGTSGCRDALCPSAAVPQGGMPQPLAPRHGSLKSPKIVGQPIYFGLSASCDGTTTCLDQVGRPTLDLATSGLNDNWLAQRQNMTCLHLSVRCDRYHAGKGSCLDQAETWSTS